MAEYLQEAVSDVRRLAAAGDFTGARRRLTQFVTANPDGGGAHVVALDEQRRTLEVLESLEVIRHLLGEGKTASVVQAAEGIRDALSAEDYSRLGVLGAALALLGRAGELARQAESGDRSQHLRNEMSAFLEHLGTELNHLQREQVDGRIHMVLQPRGTTATLGDLLSRRPSRSSLLPTVEPPRSAEPPRAAQVDLKREPPTDSPVIGRILIAQEQQERVNAAVQPQTLAGRVDMFDLVGAAALRYWHVIAFIALGLAAAGYWTVTASPQKYESSSTLQKEAAVHVGLTPEQIPYQPFHSMLQIASDPNFHAQVADKISKRGWSPDGRPADPIPVSQEQVSLAMTATSTVTGPNSYQLKLAAVTAQNERACQAIVGVAADELVARYVALVTQHIDGLIAKDNQDMAELLRRLESVQSKRVSEISSKDSISVGVTLKERIDQLVEDLRKARTQKQSEQTSQAAAQQEEKALREIAERIPKFEDMPPGPRLVAMRSAQADMEKELTELARQRDDLGPEHPKQRRIKNVQEDLRLIEKEIDELERSEQADVDRRKANPLRAQADSRLVEAQAETAKIQLRLAALEQDIPKIEAELNPLMDRYQASENLRKEEDVLTRDKESNQRILDTRVAVRAAAAGAFTILTPATPGKQVPRQELVGIAVGLIAGLVIGIGVAVALLRRRQLAEAEALA